MNEEKIIIKAVYMNDGKVHEEKTFETKEWLAEMEGKLGQFFNGQGVLMHIEKVA